MPSKLVEDKKRYLYDAYIGHSNTFLGRIWCWIKRWFYGIDKWNEGEILHRYYTLTNKGVER